MKRKKERQEWTNPIHPNKNKNPENDKMKYEQYKFYKRKLVRHKILIIERWKGI